jgi:hypothetical protein
LVENGRLVDLLLGCCEDDGLLLRSGEKRARPGVLLGSEWEVVVWSGERNRGQEGCCGLNRPEAVHGGLGLERGGWRGRSASALAGVAVWTRPTAWTVLLDASNCRLARVRCWPERHPAGARPRSGGSGRRGVEVREGEGGRACASRSLDNSSPHARERE